MDRFSHVARQIARFLDQEVARTAAVIGGVFLMIGGLGLLATVVFLPGGLILGVAGALLIAVGARPRRDVTQR